MKRNSTIITLALLIATVGMQAQNYFKFETGTLAYTALQAPAAITLHDPQGDGRYFSYNLSLPTFNHTGVFKGNQTTSQGAFVAYSGYLAVYNPSESHTIIYQAMLPEGSNKLRFSANSSMGYVYEGAAGSGVLKVEWKNMGITGRHDSEFVSLQVWFNEADKSITYHYGPRSISTDFRIFSGVFSTPNATFGTFDNAINLSGNPASPVTTSASGFNNLPVVDKMPPAGTYYKFGPGTTGISSIEAKNPVSVYPNPARHQIFVDMQEETTAFVLCNAAGQQVISGTLVQGTNTINAGALAAGVYYLQAGGTEGLFTQKIVIGQ